ncbi:hypothetical protein COV17_03860 [Candidatus Woesearchaeota archaeon CG10_big_fil_rev_8_21_14_0_10_36_11]|nr:MAG: hypothetical protein COV17_03860 [Candidatus Woesearchaeota archaeon CG10_big_fil_rev_8_21_14_0_10_36_11]
MVQMEMETIQRASVLSRMHDYVFGVAELIPVRSVLKVAGLVSVLGVVKATLEYVGVDKDTLDLLLMHGPAIAQGAVGGIGAVLASHIAFTDDATKREKQALFFGTVAVGLVGGYSLSLLETTLGYETVNTIATLF